MALDKAGIIDLAEEAVSRGSELDTIAENYLDLILSQIYINTTSNYLSKEPLATITFTAGTNLWTVPTDYLKFNTLVLVRTDINPTQPPNIPLHLIDFADFQMLNVPTVQSTPRFVAINRTVTLDGLVVQGYCYPTPNVNYTGRMSYFYLPAFNIADAAVPAFPDQKTIVDLLVNELYGYLKDPRYQKSLFELILVRYRRNQADMGIYPTIAKLDKRKFRSHSQPRNWWGGFGEWN